MLQEQGSVGSGSAGGLTGGADGKAAAGGGQPSLLSLEGRAFGDSLGLAAPAAGALAGLSGLSGASSLLKEMLPWLLPRPISAGAAQGGGAGGAAGGGGAAAAAAAGRQGLGAANGPRRGGGGGAGGGAGGGGRGGRGGGGGGGAGPRRRRVLPGASLAPLAALPPLWQALAAAATATLAPPGMSPCPTDVLGGSMLAGLGTEMDLQEVRAG